VLTLKAKVSLNLVLGIPAYKLKLQWCNIAATQTIITEIIVLHYYKKGICSVLNCRPRHVKLKFRIIMGEIHN